MFSTYGILGILLLVFVFLLGFENYEVWFSPYGKAPKKETAKKVEGKADLPPPVLIPKEPVPRQDFAVIAEKNIFNPERKEFAAVAGPGMAKPVARPQITLYGVGIKGDYQAASITNPGRVMHKGEREAKTVKIGDMIGDYKLTKIMPDRIVVEAGDDSFEVLLYDARAPKRRVEVRTPTQPPRITSTAPTSPTPSVPARPGVSSPSPPGTRPAAPIALPRPSLPARQGTIQPPGQPPASPSSPDPGVWRGRRPVYPGSPPGTETK